MIEVVNFKVKREGFNLFGKKNKESFFRAEICLEDEQELEPGKVIKTNFGTKMLVLKAKDGINYVRTIRKEGGIIEPASIEVLPWKYIPQN